MSFLENRYPLFRDMRRRGETMWIGTEDAVKIYARFCCAHDGAAAVSKARHRAQQLKRVGDLEGHRVWNAVAEAIRERQHMSDRNVRLH
jgi:hypothetical protein